MVRYKILVRGDGEDEYRYAGRTFKDKKKAHTFANLETVAGMGEEYIVREEKEKTKRQEHSKA
jgi:hypothetical protein